MNITIWNAWLFKPSIQLNLLEELVGLFEALAFTNSRLGIFDHYNDQKWTFWQQ